MADTTTTVLGLTKPEVGAADGRNLWGGKINTDLDMIDAAVGDLQTDLATAEANINDLGTDLTAAEADIAALETSVAAIVAIPTGAVMPYVGSTAPSGWLLLRGGTIGDASSGGTVRANADCEDLFTLLWNSMANSEAAVSSGRGASAAADWAAHKTITLPDAGGRVIAGKEATATRLTSAGSGVDGGTLGKSGGDQLMQQHNHTATDAGHTHGYSDPGHSHTLTQGGSGPTSYTARAAFGDGINAGAYGGVVGAGGIGISIATNYASISVANSGSGGSQNVQPTLVLNYIIAL
jgi:microcystin-dependent protein